MFRVQLFNFYNAGLINDNKHLKPKLFQDLIDSIIIVYYIYFLGSSISYLYKNKIDIHYFAGLVNVFLLRDTS